MQRIHFILVSACVFGARPLLAQATADTTATAFRRGQWGVDFIPSRSLAEGGVLRFSTPRLAWVLDGSAAFDQQTSTGAGGSGRSISVNARVGPRWYHTEYERVVRFAGFGVTGGYVSSSQFFTTSGHQKFWSAGVYGELGLQYLFTRHLGLGVRGDVVGLRNASQVTQESSVTQRQTSYHVALEPVQLLGTFYF
jgi:hypothetical protein